MFWKLLSRFPRFGKGGGETPSLAFVLAVWYTALALFMVAMATGLLYYALAANLKDLSEQIMSDEVDVCRALIRARSEDSHALREEVEIDSDVRRYQKFYIRVLDDQGHALFTTPGMDNEISSARIAAEAAQQHGQIFWLRGATGKPYRAVVREVPRELSHTGPWTLQLAMDLSQEVEVLSQHRIWVWCVLILAAVLCPRLALSIARWSTRSLREVSDTARRISSTTLSKRIQVQDYPREIAIMAESFNSMLNRLEDSFLRLSRFSADLAHELRTPVNNIRGESEVALARTRSPEEYRDALGSCLEESVRLSELIESLLFLARSENPGKHLRKQPCNIATLLSSVCEYYEASASEAGVTLSLKCSDGVDIQADPALLQRAIGNLVSNSLANTSPGGAVNLTGRRQQQEFYIVVKDTGKGIPSDDLPKVFDRFFRSDPSRTRGSGGSGLGLAIVRQIIQLHGGDVKIESQVGIGTSISVVLPLQN